MPPLNKPKNIRDYKNNPSLNQLNKRLAQDSINVTNEFKTNPLLIGTAIPKQFQNTPVLYPDNSPQQLATSIGDANNAQRERLYAQQQAILNQRFNEEQKLKTEQLKIQKLELENERLQNEPIYFSIIAILVLIVSITLFKLYRKK